MVVLKACTPQLLEIFPFAAMADCDHLYSHKVTLGKMKDDGLCHVPCLRSIRSLWLTFPD